MAIRCGQDGWLVWCWCSHSESEQLSESVLDVEGTAMVLDAGTTIGVETISDVRMVEVDSTVVDEEREVDMACDDRWVVEKACDNRCVVEKACDDW